MACSAAEAAFASSSSTSSCLTAESAAAPKLSLADGMSKPAAAASAGACWADGGCSRAADSSDGAANRGPLKALPAGKMGRGPRKGQPGQCRNGSASERYSLARASRHMHDLRIAKASSRQSLVHAGRGEHLQQPCRPQGCAP